MANNSIHRTFTDITISKDIQEPYFGKDGRMASMVYFKTIYDNGPLVNRSWNDIGERLRDLDERDFYFEYRKGGEDIELQLWDESYYDRVWNNAGETRKLWTICDRPKSTETNPPAWITTPLSSSGDSLVPLAGTHTLRLG